MKEFLKEIAFLIRYFSGKSARNKAAKVFSLESYMDSQNQIYASHSGNIGDVIFACLYLKSCWEQTGKKFCLHLQTDVPAKYQHEHPLVNIRMNIEMASQLKPLLSCQEYISEVTYGPKIPSVATLDLDVFRLLPIDLRCGLIQGWQQLCTDIWLNVFEPWIETSILPEYQDKIIVSRTARLRSEYIDYKFLKAYKDQLLFVGVPNECKRFKDETGISCSFLTLESFDHLAKIIHSCHLFIGNQGFAYTLAESLKCPRVLESNSLAPNNFPMSSNGRIAIFQEPFEKFVNEAHMWTREERRSNTYAKK